MQDNSVAGPDPRPDRKPAAGGCCSPTAAKQARAADGAMPPLSSAISGTAMADLPGGEFLMGTDYPHGFAADGEGPVRPVVVRPFRIDAVPVTNGEFARFVEQTGYRTEAERFGWSFVFWSQIPRERFREVVEDTVADAPWWCKVPGSAWNHPYGPGSDLRELEEHPVVHVSWNDASAYAAITGKRLPTEAEWEYAARGGLQQKLFPWGDELQPGGEHRANVWQGRFPQQDTAEDGFAGTCPVRAFPPNQYGIYSVVGNVWEWCADVFTTDHTRPVPLGGPDAGKVMKGGSFLCHASYCNRYRLAARTQNSPDSSTSNIGFRCAAPQ